MGHGQRNRVAAGLLAIPCSALLLLGAAGASKQTEWTSLAAGLWFWSVPPKAFSVSLEPSFDDEDLEKPSMTLSTDGRGMDSLSGAAGLLTVPSGQTEQKTAGPVPYPESLESHDGVIAAVHYQESMGTQYFSLDKAGQVRNMTSVPMDILQAESKKLPEFKIKPGIEPQVLIMHTHTTESYEPYERDFYDASFRCRTTDETKNVVAVGEAMAAQLKAAGIGVIHDSTIHDYPSYNGAYDRSAETVKKILAEHPSIKVVIDLHRDAIERKDGERVAPTAPIEGKNAAQVMIISGCDDGTMNMPGYMKNFRLAALWQQQMESDYPGLTRPVMFAYKKYNQDLTSGSLLIEVGGHANSLEQAKYSGELAGKSLAKALSALM